MVIRQVTRPYHRQIWLHIQVLFLWTVAKHCLQQAQKFWLIPDLYYILQSYLFLIFNCFTYQDLILSLGKDKYFLSHDCIPNTQHGVWHRNACCARNVCFDEMKKGATCGETGLGKLYLFTCLIEYLCAPPWPGWCTYYPHKVNGNGGNYVDKSGRMNHPLNINCLVILGGSSLKLKSWNDCLLSPFHLILLP